MFDQWDRLGRRLPFERSDRYPVWILWVYDSHHGLGGTATRVVEYSASRRFDPRDDSHP
jgi:hypothetical protein